MWTIDDVVNGAGGFKELFVNDSMKFKFNAWNHDLWRFPDNATWAACDFSNAVRWAAALDDQVGFGQYGRGYLHQFTEAGDVYIGCKMSGLCSFGMKQHISVIEPCTSFTFWQSGEQMAYYCAPDPACQDKISH